MAFKLKGHEAVWSKVGRALASVVGLVLAGGFVAGSGLMNFAFLSRQAEHANEGLILGAIAVGVTGYNALGAAVRHLGLGEWPDLVRGPGGSADVGGVRRFLAALRGGLHREQPGRGDRIARGRGGAA